MTLSRISTRVHIASSDPALFGAFTACGISIARNFRTQRAGTAFSEVTCGRCRAAITGKSTVPTVKDGIAYVEDAGWKFSHRSILGTYVFYNERLVGQFNHELAFTLPELRDAVVNGF